MPRKKVVKTEKNPESTASQSKLEQKETKQIITPKAHKVEELEQLESNSSEFLKSLLSFFLSLLLILALVVGYFGLASQINFQKNVQAKFSSVDTELDALWEDRNMDKNVTKKLNTERPKPVQNLLGIEKPNLSYDNFSGDPNSRFVLVVYVDMECPFCKINHENLIKLQQEFPNLAIVYRHFPIETLHKNALILAKATECAKTIGGQQDFWKLTNTIFLNQKLLQYRSGLLKIVQNSGLDAVAIEDCVQKNQTLDKVKYDQNEAYTKLANIGFGTPASILFDNGQETGVVINGAVAYGELRQVIAKNVR